MTVSTAMQSQQRFCPSHKVVSHSFAHFSLRTPHYSARYVPRLSLTLVSFTHNEVRLSLGAPHRDRRPVRAESMRFVVRYSRQFPLSGHYNEHDTSGAPSLLHSDVCRAKHVNIQRSRSRSSRTQLQSLHKDKQHHTPLRCLFRLSERNVSRFQCADRH